MARTILGIVGACVIACSGLVSGAQPTQDVASATGLRIVMRNEVRAAPGVAESSEELVRALALRKELAPPDGIYRSTIYVKGSAIRSEYTAPANQGFSIYPAGSKMCYIVNAREKTFTKYRIPTDYAASHFEVKNTPTDSVETIASLPAREVRYVAEHILRYPPRADPWVPTTNGNDGANDGYGGLRYADPRSAEVHAPEPRTIGTEEGRMWLVDLPPGGDTQKLATVLLGHLASVATRRFPARHIRSSRLGNKRMATELVQTVESIESVSLDDSLFLVPAGFREVSFEKLREWVKLPPTTRRR